MENLQNLKYSPWVSEKFDLKDYFDKYKKAISNVFREDDGNPISFEQFILDGKALSIDEGRESIAQFDVAELEEACSIDLLTVEGEVPIQSIKKGPKRILGHMSNWYAGSYSDGVIPEGKDKKLETLKLQQEELIKRLTVKDYGRLRNRGLKYNSTIRSIPIEDDDKEDKPLKGLDEIILNIRIQRPYHKKTHHKKACNPFPTHNQELLFLGSQSVADLRDAITCINDMAINTDMSETPFFSRLPTLKNGAEEFPSGFIYIYDTFYVDYRHANAKDYSEPIRQWAKRYPEIGELKVADMSKVKLEEIVLRLGYPYVYVHQGNCEHLVTFTDVRLHHHEDVFDVKKYPITRGQAPKVSVKCYSCNLHLANWVVKNDLRIPVPNAHMCDKCLKYFCYYSNMKKVTDVKVYPFFDEFNTDQKKYIGKKLIKKEVVAYDSNNDPVPKLEPGLSQGQKRKKRKRNSKLSL